MLSNKSQTELRGIAQMLGIADVFQKDKTQLIQAIELKQANMGTPAPAPVPQPEYDARLMTKSPAKRSDQASIEDVLKEHIARGLHLSFDDERWYMQLDRRTDQGTLRMPLRHVLYCANRIMG